MELLPKVRGSNEPYKVVPKKQVKSETKLPNHSVQRRRRMDRLTRRKAQPMTVRNIRNRQTKIHRLIRNIYPKEEAEI